MHFEKAAVLFNLASVLTQQALNADRASDAGRKDSARKFQVCPAVPALHAVCHALPKRMRGVNSPAKDTCTGTP